MKVQDVKQSDDNNSTIDTFPDPTSRECGDGKMNSGEKKLYSKCIIHYRIFKNIT